MAFFKDCCDDKITDLEKYAGSVSWNLGSVTCDAPIICPSGAVLRAWSIRAQAAEAIGGYFAGVGGGVFGRHPISLGARAEYLLWVFWCDDGSSELCVAGDA